MSTDDILKERGKEYGEFPIHAEISQAMKELLKGNTRLDHVHTEALEMIFHKIARILNGNPNNMDSWADIAGYAELVTRYIKSKSANIDIGCNAMAKPVDTSNTRLGYK